MSASQISSQPMSSINYNAPLKSVRTRRPVVAEHEAPKNPYDGSMGDESSSTHEGDMKKPGVSFMWENAPGKAKKENEEKSRARAELKPPPLSQIPIKASSGVAIQPPPAGTPPAKSNPFVSLNPPPGAPPPPAGTPPSKYNPFSTLPPKPSIPTSKSSPALSQQPTDRVPTRPASPARRSVTPPSGGQARFGQYDGQRTPPSELERTRYNSVGTDTRDPHSSLERGSHDYLNERLRQAPMTQKDFYPTRNAPPSTVPNGSYTTQPNSRLQTRPSSRDNSEAGSHSSAEWDADHTSDAGDMYSQMDHYQAQCQVSMLDGCIDMENDSSRHTDPSARDFIMQRFLPAAKAMVTESADSVDRRSPNGTPSVSPRKGSRSSLPGRSRFATFKQQFDIEEEESETDDPGMLFKCKFPWQMGPFTSMCLPGPAPQPGDNPNPDGSATVIRGKNDDQQEGMEAAWAYARTDSSMSKDENRGSFEDRHHPSNFRTRSSSSTNSTSVFKRDGEGQSLSHSRSFGVDSQNGDYEGETSARSNDARGFYGVPNDRLQETATHREWNKTPPRAKPQGEFSANLGTLLRTSNQHGRGMARLVPPAQHADAMEAEAKKQAVPDASISNHHMYKSSQSNHPNAFSDGRGREVSPSPLQSVTLLSRQGSFNDGRTGHPQPLQMSLYKQQPAGGSGRSLDSIDDGAWEAIDQEPTTSGPSKSRRDENYDHERVRKGIAAINLHNSDLADDKNSVGWPLGKAYSRTPYESRAESAYTRTPSQESKHDSSYSRTPSQDSKYGSSYSRTPSTDSKTESIYTRNSSTDSKHDSYARTPSTDSKNESFSTFSENSAFNQQQQDKSPISVLQLQSPMPPTLPKGPSESWLWKVRPPAPVPLATMANWQQPGPKKFLNHSISGDTMDVKWEALVKSENAHLRVRPSQDIQNRDRD